jgi:hypothetical protein
MSDRYASLHGALGRSQALAAMAVLVLCAITGICIYETHRALATAQAMVQRMPVLVVPGAVGGVYSPGLTQENVRAVARYLTSLATNFSGSRGLQDHFDEIETFATAAYLPRLQAARGALAHDVEVQGQARAFYPAVRSESLEAHGTQSFDYRIEGERAVFSSGLPMSWRSSQVHLRLVWGVPSPANHGGIALEAFDITDLSAEPARQAAPTPLASPATPATATAPLSQVKP